MILLMIIQSARVSGRSSELAPPTPFSTSVCPHKIQVGDTRSLGGKGEGGANSVEWTDTLLLYCICKSFLSAFKDTKAFVGFSLKLTS